MNVQEISPKITWDYFLRRVLRSMGEKIDFKNIREFRKKVSNNEKLRKKLLNYALREFYQNLRDSIAKDFRDSWVEAWEEKNVEKIEEILRKIYTEAEKYVQISDGITVFKFRKKFNEKWLHIGVTDKIDVPGLYAGIFGEGLKVALSILEALGVPAEIKTSKYVYRADLSKGWVEIRKEKRKDRKKTRGIFVKAVTSKSFSPEKENFLLSTFVNPYISGDFFTYFVRVIRGSGKIFHHGVIVDENADTLFSYDIYGNIVEGSERLKTRAEFLKKIIEDLFISDRKFGNLIVEELLEIKKTERKGTVEYEEIVIRHRVDENRLPQLIERWIINKNLRADYENSLGRTPIYRVLTKYLKQAEVYILVDAIEVEKIRESYTQGLGGFAYNRGVVRFIVFDMRLGPKALKEIEKELRKLGYAVYTRSSLFKSFKKPDVKPLKLGEIVNDEKMLNKAAILTFYTYLTYKALRDMREEPQLSGIVFVDDSYLDWKGKTVGESIVYYNLSSAGKDTAIHETCHTIEGADDGTHKFEELLSRVASYFLPFEDKVYKTILKNELLNTLEDAPFWKFYLVPAMWKLAFKEFCEENSKKTYLSIENLEKIRKRTNDLLFEQL